MPKRIIFSSVLLIPILFIGSSFLEESERYVLILGDEYASSNDVYLEFYEIESVKNRQVMVDEGFVLFDDKEYWITNDWKGSFLNDDNLFFMVGKAENSDETIDVVLTGKFLRKTIDGSLYDITVHIHSDQHLQIETNGEIIGITPKETPKEIPKEIESIDLLFLIKDTHHRTQDQEYSFTTKLYDKKQNPTSEWNVHGGEISGAEIIVQVFDLEGNTLREIKGSTNEFGWFDGEFPIDVTIFPRGEYLVLYTAKYQNNIVEDTKPLYVFEEKTDANYRHFIPSADIDAGQWLDDLGNDNDLMYDDLDEFPGDASDYVRSRSLGSSNPSNTLHLKMSLDGNSGFASSHSHIISYTLKKDTAGGNEIKFTVTLFEGSQQIAQWTHLDVDESFLEIINILSHDQMLKDIINYDDISLEFTAECVIPDGDTECGKGKETRRGQIYYVHMIV